MKGAKKKTRPTDLIAAQALWDLGQRPYKMYHLAKVDPGAARPMQFLYFHRGHAAWTHNITQAFAFGTSHTAQLALADKRFIAYYGGAGAFIIKLIHL